MGRLLALSVVAMVVVVVATDSKVNSEAEAQAKLREAIMNIYRQQAGGLANETAPVEKSPELPMLFFKGAQIMETFKKIQGDFSGFQSQFETFFKQSEKVFQNLIKGYLIGVKDLIIATPDEEVKAFGMHVLNTTIDFFREFNEMAQNYNPLHPKKSGSPRRRAIRAAVDAGITTVKSFGGNLGTLLEQVDEIIVICVDDFVGSRVEDSAQGLEKSRQELEEMTAADAKELILSLMSK